MSADRSLFYASHADFEAMARTLQAMVPGLACTFFVPTPFPAVRKMSMAPEGAMGRDVIKAQTAFST